MGKKPISSSRLHVMIKELAVMKQELIPDKNHVQEEDLKGLDDFQKAKTRLTGFLMTLSESVREYAQLKKAKGGQRDVKLIAMANDNSKQLLKAESMTLELQKAFDKWVKKKGKKIDPEEKAEREKLVVLYKDEVEKLKELNARAGRIKDADGLSETTQRHLQQVKEKDRAREERKKKLEEKRAARRAANKGKKGKGKDTGADEEEDEEDAEPAPAPLSVQEQEFLEEKVQNDKKIDELLDIINGNLVELKEIAVDIGKNVDIQNDMLDNMATKMEGTIDNMKTTNRRLKELIIANSGGAAKWCPMLIALVILVAIVGYIITISKNR